MKFCDDNPNCGIWYTIAETTSQFDLANSESTKCKQKLVICMYDREYAVQSTEFDIVEQGHVPILMSLPQMRNLRFQFELHPDKALISSPVLGIWDVKLKVAPSSHLVLDLPDLSRLMWKKSSFLTYFFHRLWEALHRKRNPKVFAFAMDDEWVIDEASMELIRLHKKTRRTRYEPKEGAVEYLDNKRKTIIEFSKAPRERMLLMKMTGVLLSLLPRRLLSLGKVGQSSRFCLVVLRIEPQYQLRQGILLVVRWDLQMKNLVRVSLETEQEHPEALHQERYRRKGEFALRDAVLMDRHPRSL